MTAGTDPLSLVEQVRLAQLPAPSARRRIRERAGVSIRAMANVRLRETSPGVVRMDHDHGRHDDRAIAIALAAHHLLDLPPSVSPAVTRHWGDPLEGYDRQMSDWASRQPATGPGASLLDVGL